MSIIFLLIGCGNSTETNSGENNSDNNDNEENITDTNSNDMPQDIGSFDANEGIGGFATGGYDENAIHSTQVGWTRQSRFKGVEDPEIKQTIELPGTLRSHETEPIVDADGNFYLKINERDDEVISNEGDYDGFYAFDREGELLWKRTNYHPEYGIIPGNAENRAPMLDSNNQLIGTLDYQTVGALDKDTGEFNFVYQIEGDLAVSPWSPAIGSDGVIYFVYDGSIVALNPDGSTKWKYEHETQGDDEEGPNFVPTITDEHLFIKNYTHIMAIDLDGNHLWTEHLGHASLPTQSNILVADDGNLYFAHDDRLLSYNPDGELLWEVEVDSDTSYMSGHNGLALSEEGLIIGLFLPNLYAFDLEGNEVWQTEGLRTYGAITIDSEGTSYFAGGNKLYSVGSNGNLNWEFELPSGDPGDPVIGPNQEIYLTIDSSSEPQLLIIGNK